MTTSSGFIYIASPYSHNSQAIVTSRYFGVMAYVAELLDKKQWCYSPILHCHPMAQRYSLPTDAAFWKDYNYTMLGAANGLHILALPGWRESLGVTDEIRWWKENRHEEIIYV